MTFTIFHHVAIFPSEKRLKGEICLGMGTLEGEKMSSSKGNVILVRDIVDRLGADMVRLFLMSFVEPWEDFDWQQRTVDATLKSVQKYYSFFLENARDKPLEKELSHADRWILSRINQTIEHVTNYMESFLFRKALQTALFEFMKDFKWYKKRTQPKPGVTAYIIKILAQLLAPFTPFICEEIWERAGGRSSVFESSWPKVDKSAIDQELEKRELQLKQTIEKVKKLKNFLQKKKKITKVLIYTVPEEKDFYSGAIELLKAELGVDVEVYASNDPKRYDPAEKAVKAKPGAPAFYIE